MSKLEESSDESSSSPSIEGVGEIKEAFEMPY
jgi:hypothetical protein